MDKSTLYVVVAGVFGLIGIAAVVRGDLVVGGLLFIAGIGLGIAANRERRRHNA